MSWRTAEELQRDLESEQAECARLRDTLRQIIKDVDESEDAKDAALGARATAYVSLKRSEAPR